MKPDYFDHKEMDNNPIESIIDEEYFPNLQCDYSIKFNTGYIGDFILRRFECILNVLCSIQWVKWSKEYNCILVKTFDYRPNNVSLILIKRIVSCISNNFQIKGNADSYVFIELYKGNCLNESLTKELVCQDYLTPGSKLDANKIINAIRLISLIR